MNETIFIAKILAGAAWRTVDTSHSSYFKNINMKFIALSYCPKRSSDKKWQKSQAEKAMKS